MLFRSDVHGGSPGAMFSGMSVEHDGKKIGTQDFGNHFVDKFIVLESVDNIGEIDVRHVPERNQLVKANELTTIMHHLFTCFRRIICISTYFKYMSSPGKVLRVASN